MTNYEYSSYSSSSSAGGGAVTGNNFDVSKAIFNQVDANQDGTIDRQEFQKWVGNSAVSAGQFDANSEAGAAINLESSSFSSSVGGTAGMFGGSASGLATSSFESSNFSSGLDLDANATVSNDVNLHSSSFESTTTTGAGYDTAAISQAASYTAESNAAWSTYGADVRGVGLYVDANPQIIRRPAAGGVQTYTQNIKVRFLQPPPVPPPGPLIIKEVRPPQPPPPPPLRVKQQAPPLPQPPPLILRERPPQPPPVQASQTVIRKLAALPVPPRSVIIERIPAAPPRPRDIIIERWIPYGPAAKRKTIVQRAEAVKEYPKPRNVIIQYEQVQVRIVRQFQRLGVTPEDPQAYIQRYGVHLLDAGTLLQQARAAGVVEDISPPAGITFTAAASAVQPGFLSSHQDTSDISSVPADTDLSVQGTADDSFVTSFGTQSFENSHTGGADAALFSAGTQDGLVEGGTFGDAHGSTVVNSASYTTTSTTGGDAGYSLDAGLAGGFSSASYESSSFASGQIAAGTSLDIAAAAFNSADKNKDGTVDATEFKQFYQGGL